MFCLFVCLSIYLFGGTTCCVLANDLSLNQVGARLRPEEYWTTNGMKLLEVSVKEGEGKWRNDEEEKEEDERVRGTQSSSLNGRVCEERTWNVKADGERGNIHFWGCINKISSGLK